MQATNEIKLWIIFAAIMMVIIAAVVVMEILS